MSIGATLAQQAQTIPDRRFAVGRSRVFLCRCRPAGQCDGWCAVCVQNSQRTYGRTADGQSSGLSHLRWSFAVGLARFRRCSIRRHAGGAGPCAVSHPGARSDLARVGAGLDPDVWCAATDLGGGPSIRCKSSQQVVDLESIAADLPSTLVQNPGHASDIAWLMFTSKEPPASPKRSRYRIDAG